MKAIFGILAIVLSFATVTPVYAQSNDPNTNSVDDQTIEERLREQGLDEAPAPIEMQEPELRGEAPSSGFVDDDGNPISQEDYDSIRSAEESNAAKNSVYLIGVLAVVAIVGTAVVIKKQR